ncbi:MAG TPA: hypothetical protein VJ813_15195 [Vicinamibacterales bacterium]|nr:hypothetical protein [Vicinamibacterales bacterium]
MNWIAGDENSFRTLPPHAGQLSSGGSENWTIFSNRLPQASH